MDIQIDENKLSGFNIHARSELIKAIKEHAAEIIREANRLESSRNNTGNGPEITSSIVKDAQLFLQKGMSSPHKKGLDRCLQIGSSILPLIVGILYNSEKLQNSWYMAVYIIVISITILVVTISAFRV